VTLAVAYGWTPADAQDHAGDPLRLV